MSSAPPPPPPNQPVGLTKSQRRNPRRRATPEGYAKQGERQRAYRESGRWLFNRNSRDPEGRHEARVAIGLDPWGRPAPETAPSTTATAASTTASASIAPSADTMAPPPLPSDLPDSPSSPPFSKASSFWDSDASQALPRHPRPTRLRRSHGGFPLLGSQSAMPSSDRSYLDQGLLEDVDVSEDSFDSNDSATLNMEQDIVKHFDDSATLLLAGWDARSVQLAGLDEVSSFLPDDAITDVLFYLPKSKGSTPATSLKHIAAPNAQEEEGVATNGRIRMIEEARIALKDAGWWQGRSA